VETLEQLTNISPHFFLGFSYLGHVQARPQFRRGGAAYKEALRLNPQSEMVAARHGGTVRSADKPEKALKSTSVSSDGPAECRGAQAPGRLVRRQKKLDEALSQFQELEKTEADPQDTRVKIGLIYFEKGTTTKLRRSSPWCSPRSPEPPRPLFLASVYGELKDYKRAVDEFKRVPPGSEYYADACVHIGYICQKRPPRRSDQLGEESDRRKAGQFRSCRVFGSMYREKGDVSAAIASCSRWWSAIRATTSTTSPWACVRRGQEQGGRHGGDAEGH